MNRVQPTLVPDGKFSNKDLETLLKELHGILKAKEVMHRKEAAEFLGVSTRTIDRLSITGAIP